MLNKKIILIFFLLLLLLAVVFLVIYFWPKKSQNEGSLTSPDLNNATEDSSKNDFYVAGIESLIPENVVSATGNAQKNKIIYVDNKTAGIYEFDPILLTKKKIGSPHEGIISEAVWSPQKDKVILNYESEKQKFIYNLKTNEEFPLSKNIQNAVFNKDGNKIFYQFAEKEGKTKISKSDIDGKNWKNLTDYPLSNVEFGLIPNSNLIYFCPEGSAFQKTACYSLTESGQDLKTITKEEYGQEIKFSEDGKKILYTSTNSQGSELNLNIMGSDGTQKKYLQINTLAEKCVLSGNEKVFCAVPELIPIGSAMPDDYRNHKFVTNDIFWEVDLSTLSKSRLSEIKDFDWGNNDATGLFFLENKQNIYFVSGEGLYVLHLKKL